VSELIQEIKIRLLVSLVTASNRTNVFIFTLLLSEALESALLEASKKSALFLPSTPQWSSFRFQPLNQAWATFPSLGAKLSFSLRVKGRTKLLNKIN
jgi:hypothetical protein